MKKGIALILITIFITVYIWYSGIVFLNINLNTLTRLFALIGAILLAWNFILSTRLQFLENLFGGLDKVYLIHHWIGKWGFLFVLLHPILLIANALVRSLPVNTYLLPSILGSYNFGIFSLYSFIILLIVTIFIKLPYHLWKLTHDFMGLPLIFLILHVYLISSDVSKNTILRVWILLFLILALLAFIYKRFFYENTSKREYIVKGISSIGMNAFKIDLERFGKPKIFSAGQFVFIKRDEGKGKDELHPFSIVNYDESGNISLGVKNLGDYTSEISSWKENESVYVYGPHGKFGIHFDSTQYQVWIAGGIGITPFISMLNEYKRLNKSPKGKLIYLIKNDSEALFSEQLNEFQQMFPDFQIEKWSSELSGHIKASDIISSDSKNYLICASAKTTLSIIEQLKNSGIESSKIKKELFTLY
jgi:predicted ferric reductase